MNFYFFFLERFESTAAFPLFDQGGQSSEGEGVYQEYEKKLILYKNMMEN